LNSSLSFGLRDLKISAKFAVVQRKTVVKFVFVYHPNSRLQAQKGVSRVGLEALLLTLEHALQNKSC